MLKSSLTGIAQLHISVFTHHVFLVVFLNLWKASGIESLETIEDSVMTVFHMSFGTFEVGSTINLYIYVSHVFV